MSYVEQPPAKDQGSEEQELAVSAPMRAIAVQPLLYIFVASILVGLGLTITAFLVYNAWQAFALVFSAVLFAIFLHTLASLFSRATGLGHGWSLALVALVLFGLTAFFFMRLGPQLADETSQLGDKVPQATAKIKEQLNRYSWGRRLTAEAKQAGGDLQGSLIMRQATTAFSATISSVGTLVIFVVLGLYFASEPKVYSGAFLKLIPAKRRERAGQVLHTLTETLRWWLFTRICSMTVIGICTAIGLGLMGIPLAFSLGVIAGLLVFIPNIGPILSAIPALLLALTQGMSLVLYVGLFYLALQAVESYVLEPLVQRKALNIPGGITIVVQLVFGYLFGIVGVALAVPMTAVIFVLIKMLYIEDVLGEPASIG